jgi:hypothetical protein
MLRGARARGHDSARLTAASVSWGVECQGRDGRLTATPPRTFRKSSPPKLRAKMDHLVVLSTYHLKWSTFEISQLFSGDPRCRVLRESSGSARSALIPSPPQKNLQSGWPHLAAPARRSSASSVTRLPPAMILQGGAEFNIIRVGDRSGTRGVGEEWHVGRVVPWTMRAPRPVGFGSTREERDAGSRWLRVSPGTGERVIRNLHLGSIPSSGHLHRLRWCRIAPSVIARLAHLRDAGQRAVCSAEGGFLPSDYQ